jgi:hypothetical protein
MCVSTPNRIKSFILSFIVDAMVSLIIERMFCVSRSTFIVSSSSERYLDM